MRKVLALNLEVRMSKTLAPILFLTLITIVAWVAFQVLKIATSSTIPEPTQQQIEKLNPTLDKSVFDDLESALK
jgi:hypothetical protein